MKIILPVAFLLSLSSCYVQKPLSSVPPANNGTYNVEYLFEHDGCKVYRFADRGNYIYITNCKGEAIVRTDSTQIRNLTRLVRE